MTTDDTIIQEIIQGDLQTLYNLLEAIKEDTPELQEAYRKAKHGITIRYHIMHNLKKNYLDRSRSNEIQLGDTLYPLEAWWDEEENRRAIMRKALLEHYTEDEKPYEGR